MCPLAFCYAQGSKHCTNNRKILASHHYLSFPSWSWSCDSWIYNYMCNQRLSPIKLSIRISLRQGVLGTTFCDKVCQWLTVGRWFSPGTSVSSTNRADHHDITELLLKVALITILPIFASQGLRSALLMFTLGIVSRIFVIPAHCHLLDFDSYAPCNDVIFSQSTRGFHFLSGDPQIQIHSSTFLHFYTYYTYVYFKW